MIRGRVLLLGAVSAALALNALRAVAQPASVSGEFGAGGGEADWIDFDWTDPARRREIPALLAPIQY